MLWRDKVKADTLPELHEKAEKTFPPGTPYSILEINDSGPMGTRTHYMAKALPEGTTGSRRTPLRKPDVPVDRRTRRGPEKGAEQFSEQPVWKPVSIPPAVLRAAPAHALSVHLLTGRDDMLPGSSGGVEEDDLMELLEHAAPPGTTTGSEADVVYVGLLDDAIKAAEADGHLLWETAGELSGGAEGATVVCFGLGTGINVPRVAEGLLAYDGLRIVLAVDPSRKTEDSRAWVTEITKVILPSALVPVSTVYTASPETINELRGLI